MKTALLIFPHHLFKDHPGLTENPDRIVVIEESLFFGDQQYPAKFHKQKLKYHRATMKRFAATLEAEGRSVSYIDASGSRDLTGQTVALLAAQVFTRPVACAETYLGNLN